MVSNENAERRTYTLRKRAEAMEDTRRRITEAAVELHGSLGPAQTTISAVAEKAGVQRNTVYRHFPTEMDLFAACSGHFDATHPPPDLEAWRAIEDPRERLSTALDQLYAFYETTDFMLSRVMRDEPYVAAITPALDALRGHLAAAVDLLTEGWPVTKKRRPLLRTAVSHTVDIHTWQSLVRDGGLRRSDAVDLAVAMVDHAAG
jgi:AcrR family transcriptional regulator